MSNRDRPFKSLSPSERWVIETTHRWSAIETAIRWVFATVIVFLAIPLPVMFGAGKDTFIGLAYLAILEGEAADKVQKALVVALMALLYYQRRSYERRLRELGGSSAERQKQLDPGRSSSHPK